MKQIIAICKQEGLPFAAQFYLKEEREDTGEPMYCTTVIQPYKHEDDHDSEGIDQIRYISECMKYGRQGKPWAMAVTVRTGE